MQKIAAASTAVLLLAGCGAFGPKTFDLTGSLDIVQWMAKDVGAPCYAAKGHDGIPEGAQVTITDASGETVAFGELQGGIAHDNLSEVAGIDTCSFGFQIDDIPGKRGDILGARVGDSAVTSFEVDGAMATVTITLR